MDKYIEINNLWKSFGKKKVIEDLTIKILIGKITCIMGESGIGKTTLFNIFMNLVSPDQGEVLGIDSLKIGAVFQEDRLIEHLNAVDNINLVINYNQDKEYIVKELKELGLTGEDIIKPVSKLSGGMRRRVCILRAILFDCDLILMDEPFKGLDDKLKESVISYIKRYQKKRTIIIITHDKNDVIELESERIVIK